MLGQALRRLPEDFERADGYRPYLVESFVDTALFDGGCYRAANWLRVGEIQGRGIKLHSTLALNDQGVPLGRGNCRCALPHAGGAGRYSAA